MASAWRALWVVLGALVLVEAAGAQGYDALNKFSNQGSIGNTRHNLTQRQLSGGGPDGFFMDRTRNDYNEVCVYCHTPHGANTVLNAPLWNRTAKTTNYQTYDELGSTTLTQTVSSTPGTSSLTCLSCHDGQVAVDSIINMPGSGRYNSSTNAFTEQSKTFLDAWTNTRGLDAIAHGRMGNECFVCHSPAGPEVGAVDFTPFIIGTDLRNDHPVGVTFPATAGPGTDFAEPRREAGRLAYFDSNANLRADSNEIRLYRGGGSDFMVECASCHDPHGVPSAGPGTTFNPTFLRISNEGSQVCLTCHVK